MQCAPAMIFTEAVLKVQISLLSIWASASALWHMVAPSRVDLKMKSRPSRHSNRISNHATRTHTSNSLHTFFKSTKFPFSSNITPSPLNNSSFLF